MIFLISQGIKNAIELITEIFNRILINIIDPSFENLIYFVLSAGFFLTIIGLSFKFLGKLNKSSNSNKSSKTNSSRKGS